MLSLSREDIIKLFNSGRVVVIFLSNHQTITCNNKLISEDDFKLYLYQDNIKGRIL